MGSKTRLGSYCTKRANNGVNLVTSRNINTRLARPIPAAEKLSVNTVDNGHTYFIARSVIPTVAIIPKRKFYPRISCTL